MRTSKLLLPSLVRVACGGRALLPEPPDARHPDLRKFYSMVVTTRPSN